MAAFSGIYTLGYVFLAFLGLGPEPKGGTPVFVPPIFTWPLVLFGIFLLRGVNNLRNRIIFFLTFFVHYVITAMFVPRFAKGFVKSWSEIWQMDAGFIIFTTFWYVSGQVIIWISFFFEKRKPRIEAE